MSGLVTTGTVNIVGTGGILEGNLDDAIINVNTDPVYGNFDATDDNVYFDTTDNDLDDMWAGNGGCCSAWIYPKSNGESNAGAIFDKDKWRLYMGTESGGKLRMWFRVKRGGVAKEVNVTKGGSVNVIPINAWSHVAVFYDSDAYGNEPIIYVNGEVVTNGTLSYTSGSYDTDAAANLGVGGNGAGGTVWDGYIMDAKIYKNVAVTATNILKMASKINVDKDAPDMPTSGLQAWWKFNASTSADSSGNSNNLTVGTALTAPVYDAFSVNVQDNTTTTDGAVTVTQGKLEGLSLSSADFDGGADYFTLSAVTLDNDWTFACWFRADEFADNVLIGSDSQQDELRFDNTTTLRVNINNQGTEDTTVSGLAVDKWFHFAYTRDDSTGVSDVYINGVYNATRTFDANQDFVFDRIGKAGSMYWDGDMRDVRIYDDAILSADQIASLYSGSYNVTPTYWWKLDDGSGNGAGSGTAAAHTASEAGTCGRTNGTLDLDALLTIETGGTLSAPRGNLDLGLAGSGNLLVRNGNGVYTHNNGKIRHTTANTGTISQSFMDANAFYDVEVSNASGNLSFDGGDITIDIEHDTSGGGNIKLYNRCIIRAGTDSRSCEWTADTILGMQYGVALSTRLEGKNQLWPVNFNPGTFAFATSPTAISLGRSLGVKWVNWQQALVIPENFKMVLTGDCEFDAVTVNAATTFTDATCDTSDDATGSAYLTVTHDANGSIVAGLFVSGTGIPADAYIASITDSTHFVLSAAATADGTNVTLTFNTKTILDLNGQRMECSGTFTNSGTTNWGGAGAMHIANRFTIDGLNDEEAGANFIVTGGSADSNNDFGDGQFVGDATTNILINNGTTSVDWSGSVYYAGNIIAGSPFRSQHATSNLCNNLTIPTGGTLNADNDTITVAGDFTTSGGLIGKSAYDFNGASSSGGNINCGSDSSIDDIFDGGGTAEAWIRIDGDAASGSGMRPFSKTNWFISIDNDGSGDVYKLRLFYFFSGDNGVWSSTNTVLSQDKWHHIAVTYNNGDVANDPLMYVDGKQVQVTESTAPTSSRDSDAATSLFLGNSLDRNRTFNGCIAMARLFTDIRTESELRADMFNAFADMNSTHLLAAMYQFDEGTGDGADALDDVSSNDNKGNITAAGSAWAGAGTFTPGTSTLKMTGAGKSLNYLSGEVLGSLNIANSSGTVTANSITAFIDATCDYNNDPTIVHDANASIVAGLPVSGTGIPAGATIASITDSTHFELSAATTGGAVTNGTLAFNDNLTAYTLEIASTGSSFTAPAGTLTVTGAIGSSNAVKCDDEGTFIHSNGTVALTASADQFMRGTNMNVAWGSAGAGVGFYNLTTSGSGAKQIRDCDVNVVNNLIIGSGTTFSNEGVNNSLTVTKHIDLTGALTVAAAGTMSTGTMTLRDNSTLTSTGTITVTGNDKANCPAGAGFNWKNFETDGTAFAPSAGTVHFVGSGIANGYIVESRFYNFIFDITGGGDVQWLDADGNTTTIGGDCTIVEGQFKRNAESDTLVVTGDVSIESGGRLGDDDDTGPNTFGSLTIASGGTYNATSGTTTITGGNSSTGYSFQNLGTFTHNKGKIKVAFTPSQNWYSQCNEYYDLELAYTENWNLYLADQSGGAITILGDLTITHGMLEVYTDADSLTVHGLTTNKGTFENAANQDTGKIIHHGLVTNTGTYRINDGTTVKMNGGIRQLGTLSIA